MDAALSAFALESALAAPFCAELLGGLLPELALEVGAVRLINLGVDAGMG